MSRLVTVAIHTYPRAASLKAQLEAEGIDVQLQNVNLQDPEVSPGMRVRIREEDLAFALRIIEHPHLFAPMPDDESGSPKTFAQPCVLVPVDLTDHSLSTTAYACRIAYRLDAKVCLLHTYVGALASGSRQLAPVLDYDTTAAAGDSRRRARQGMAAFAGRLRDMMKHGTVPPVSVTTKVLEGVPEDVISELASRITPVLTVMGSRNADEAERQLVGSVTAEVLDMASFTILAVPDAACQQSTPWRALSEGPRKILFFTNQDQQDLLALDTVYRLYPGLAAEVRLLSLPPRRKLFERVAATADTRQALESLMDYCRIHYPDSTFTAHTPVSMNALAAEIRAIVQSGETDLVIIPNRRQRRLLSRLFNPSLATTVLLSCDLPILAIPV